MSNFTNVTHVIFDMDGLLINTEDLYSLAYQNICTPYGKTYDWETKVQIMGKKPEVAAKFVIDKLQLPLTVAEWTTAFHKQLDTVFSQSKLLPGVEKLINHLNKHKIPTALCSGSSLAAYKAKTTHLSDFFLAFEPKVLCGDDAEVKHGKPHPDAYEVTRKRFSIVPPADKCLVFEDAPNGVQSGVSAGMQVVMIPDKRMDVELTKQATLVLKSMEDFKPELFGLPPF